MPAVTLSWHACKYKVHKLHQKGEKARPAYPLGGEGGGTDGEEGGLGLAGNALPCRKQTTIQLQSSTTGNSSKVSTLPLALDSHVWKEITALLLCQALYKPFFFQKHYQILPHSFTPPLPIQYCVCVVCESFKLYIYIYASSMWPVWCRRCLSL